METQQESPPRHISAKYEQISSVSAAIVTGNKQARTIQEPEIYH